MTENRQKAALDDWTDHQALCWYDDYLWWGIAASKAFDSSYEPIFGADKVKFQTMANDVWGLVADGDYATMADDFDFPQNVKTNLKARGEVMAGAPDAWAKLSPHDHTYFTTPGDTWAKPRFNGGVWQFDLFTQNRPSLGSCPSNPGNPSEDTLGPFQDTVINDLYFVFASRLAQAGQQTKKGAHTFLTAGETEYAFLENWFPHKQHSLVTSDVSLLWRYTEDSNGPSVLTDIPDRVLVRERVGTYASDDKGATYPSVNDYDPQRVWTGDQGLMLGGLVDYAALHPEEPASEVLALSILAGVADCLTLPGDAGLQSFSPAAFPDPPDYSSGSGIFWRYLLWAFERNDEVRNRILNGKVYPTVTGKNCKGKIKDGSLTYLDIVHKSAAAAALPNYYSPAAPPIFQHFNRLSVLTTAIAIEEGQK